MRFSSVRLLSVALVISFATRGLAVQPSESLLPATTKGFISTHDVDEVRNKFNETQLGEMAADPVMKPFIDDLRKQIGAKLEKAGKRLGLKWKDMEGVYAGESTLALIQPDPKDKMSHATVLIVDITGKRDKADEMLAKVDKNQKEGKAVRTAHAFGGVTMTVYTQPLKAGEKVAEQSYYFIKDDTLVISDHKAVSEGIVGRFGGQATDSLATVEAFKYTMARNVKEAAGVRHHVRWFVEPFGFAEAHRASQGGRKKRGTDLLKILPTQGFNAIQGVGGYVFFATGSEEVLHRTYVYAPAVKRDPAKPSKDKYDLAMRMLNFPNGGDLEPQKWVLSDVGGYLTFNGKLQDAFKYSETLVDAIAGDKGVFEEIWNSMKHDPNGPKIDIYAELINHLGERASLLTDITVPVHLKSERQMAFIEVKDAAIVARTLEKAFKDDPAAKKHTYRGHIIWEIQQEETLTEEPELVIEGAGFVNAEKKKKGKDDEEEEPKLPNMALTVFEGHLVVSTHMSFVEEFLGRAKDPNNLAKMDDFKRVHAALTKRGMAAADTSIRYFSRTDETFHHTYEMLKQGKLPETESFFARILNAMLSEDEDEVRKPEIDGSKLPEFELVKKYLGPGGIFAVQENEGWYLVGTLLKKEVPLVAKAPAAAATEASVDSQGSLQE
ncbi:MAG TPA: hypothetical protein VFV87_08340 [Pirellulaceae bacterium]|nr:hypothetical protein [Pirellulaceae bacterium]